MQNLWFWAGSRIMVLVIDLEMAPLRSVDWYGRGSYCTELRINWLFCLVGVRPGSRAPFVSAKGAKTIDAPSGLMTGDGRESWEGEPTRLRSNKARRILGVSIQRAGRQASDLGRRAL